MTFVAFIASATHCEWHSLQVSRCIHCKSLAMNATMCCSVLQSVAVHLIFTKCGVLQCVAVCCSLLQSVAVHLISTKCVVLQCVAESLHSLQVTCNESLAMSAVTCNECNDRHSLRVTLGVIHCIEMQCVAVHCRATHCKLIDNPGQCNEVALHHCK